jgi:predicted DNA-binding antitoxin AbrB/MazE fold protein
MHDITVVYESGIFRPTTPIDFEEGQQLQVRVLEPEIPPLTLEQALQPLIRRGAITMPPRNRPTSLPETPLSLSPPSEFESYGISPTSQNLLSESIIEDRGSF